MDGDARVSATLEHTIKGRRVNALKRTFTSEANDPCIAAKVENAEKGRETYEHTEKSDQMTHGSDGAVFAMDNMWQFPKKLSLVATQNMLMAKAKIETQKKLDECKTIDNSSTSSTTMNEVERGTNNLDEKPEISSLKRSSDEDKTRDSNSESVTMMVPDPDFHDFDKHHSEIPLMIIRFGMLMTTMTVCLVTML